VITHALDVLSELVARLPAHTAASHQALLDTLLPNLLYPRALVRKRAALTLGPSRPLTHHPHAYTLRHKYTRIHAH
jgi:hypothetical protein